MPQLAGSVSVSAQVAPHAEVRAAHEHCPPAQTCAGPHACPHAPQLRGSLVTSVHAPPQACSAPGQAHAPA
jgi:hypothetical protein